MLQARLLQALSPVLLESNKKVSDMPEDIAATHCAQNIPQLTVCSLTADHFLACFITHIILPLLCSYLTPILLSHVSI